jgi:site-specific DNA-cytosine methylase
MIEIIKNGRHGFTYVVAFAGAGGSCLGLKAAGGIAKCLIEWVPPNKNGKPSKQVPYDHLVVNFPQLTPKVQILNEDICTVSGQKILKVSHLEPGELDIYQSSFPCQGFSSSNTERDTSDPRNLLYLESIKHLKTLKPKIVIFENVCGLSRGKMKETFYRIVKALENEGYHVKSWELEASGYGAPQVRPRTWFIGIRKDFNIEPSVPPYINKIVAVKDILPHILGIREGQFAMRYHPANKPCPTITKTPGFMVITRNEEIRKPNLEELRILSTFPKDYIFLDKDDFKNNHALCGNAILPLQMKVLGEHLIGLI